MDLLSVGFQSTPLEELGLSPIREPPTHSQPVVGGRVASAGKSKKKGKGRDTGESSRAVDEGGRPTRERGPSGVRRSASFWQRPGMWARISDAYVEFCTAGGKYHGTEQCWKYWEWVRRAIIRFAGIYENNSRTITSGMSMEDVKNLLLQQYPEKEKFGAFKYWDAYVVLQNSSKFRAGVATVWPK